MVSTLLEILAPRRHLSRRQGAVVHGVSTLLEILGPRPAGHVYYMPVEVSTLLEILD